MEEVVKNLMINHQESFKSLFQRKNRPLDVNNNSNATSPSTDSLRPIPQLSPIANSVVARCSKILKVSTGQLQHRYDIELPESVKQLFTYARNFVEFCGYQTLYFVNTRGGDYLSDPEFRLLTYDLMLAWESPSVDTQSDQIEFPSLIANEEEEDEEGSSLFHFSSTNMAVKVDNKKTVGAEAFARIAPACAAISDVITVHNLFAALTSSTANRLHFILYDKYLRNLDKVIKNSKNSLGQSLSGLNLAEGEFPLEIDGSVPTQPVLQHIGMSAWPGRLTLTNNALYFESLGVGSYEKAVKYDLSTDMKQVIRPELTGPLGARLFDKAVMYKSLFVTEPVYFEFPEFKGNSRRDYWLDLCLEVLRAHKFIRKHNFNKIQESEVLAKVILGIFRYRAIREDFNIFSSQYKTLLAFNLAESLPRGDTILKTLSSRLSLLNDGGGQREILSSPYAKQKQKISPVAVLTLDQLGFSLQTETNLDGESIGGDIFVGETNPLETAVKQSISDTGRAEAAQATVDQVKVEGIDTNAAVMKELLFPVIAIASRLQILASWKEPFKSSVFLVLSCYAILRGWIAYILPLIFTFLAVLMLWRKHFNRGRESDAFKITLPPNKNAVEQLLTLQEAITKFEALIQAGNILLLKIRALLFAAVPPATDTVAACLVLMAIVIVFVPLRITILCLYLEAYTRELSYRKESTDRFLRRIREWWIKIPAAPVHIIKADEKKKKR